jgi:hypothetical protein
MAEDFVSIQDRIQRGHKAAENSTTHCLIALKAINIANGEQEGLPTDEVLSDAVGNCGDTIRPTGTSATLHEMIASGEFSRLHNERLRTLLYEFDQSVEMYARTFYVMLRNASNVDVGVLSDVWRFEVQLDAEDANVRLKTIGMDRDRILGDRRFRSSLLAFNDVARINLTWLSFQQQRVDEIVDILSSDTKQENTQ